MFEELRDDAIVWANYSPVAHPSEIARMAELVSDPIVAKAYLEFGLRPLGRMDLDPYNQPIDYYSPWVPKVADLSQEPVLVDVATGWRFRVDPDGYRLSLDLEGSNNWLEAHELLSRARYRNGIFKFETYNLSSFHPIVKVEAEVPWVRPLELKAGNISELKQQVDQLSEFFCGQLPVRRLWFRGQRQEYLLARDPPLSTKLYGGPLPSLTPSIERYAKAHPEKMNFGFAFAGPNHFWKKPFLIWLMRQNAHWFAYDQRMLPHLMEILVDDNDERFAELLTKIYMSPLEIGAPPHLPWPNEVDDLRQWFFSRMKRREFAVTLQQYGYQTSLLDLTDDLDVALYFTQASMVRGAMRCGAPKPGRIIYVFAESGGDFFHHGGELFWGADGWVKQPPPRLGRQKAGFIIGATNRNQNFYGVMIVAKIWLGDDNPTTSLVDVDLFPPESDDLLFSTLKSSRPKLEELY
ncbi:hypothetical protein Rpal_2499 [Rhodopseudomonas palustris TIE-1]|uniref:hypothetical protein n=1 Tax=Rhodopseudomonas palustris TaxID=1076 RepID=UPI00017796B6|nr:hypothetical protein [Rhodopseudomonas palustris]ACF01013.1 hypothetical protein Rpal_2499 [Rhodopseudomonas palustris TIE-1]